MNQMAFLEDFGSPLAAPLEPSALLPAENAGRYDEGYEAGWNDAMNSEKDAAEKVQRDMAIALQEAGFTYFEARQHVLKSLHPVLRAISEVILPKLAQESLGPKVIETIEALAQSIEEPIEVLCPPEAEQSLAEICQAHISFPVEIRPEATLSDQQVLFRYADGTSDLDMTQCVTNIQSAIGEFYSSFTEQEVQHA